MTFSLVDIVSGWSDRVQNGRSLSDVLESINSEVVELREEIEGTGDGRDGVFGEAVDIIAGALDVIRLVRPNVPIGELEREVAEYLDRKCAKWAAGAKQDGR